jgi:hypothetical protein
VITLKHAISDYNNNVSPFSILTIELVWIMILVNVISLGQAVSDKNNRMIILRKQSLGLPSGQLGIEDL